MQNTIIKEFENHPEVVVTTLDQGGDFGELKGWVKTFWRSNFLRDFTIWDESGNVGTIFEQPETGLPFGRGFIIDRAGKVALPFFGHKPQMVIDTIYDMLGCEEPEAYCAGKLASHGSVPALDWSGPASVGRGEWSVNVTGMIPGMPAVLLSGREAASLPFQGGMLCVGGTIRRWPLRLLDDSGGAQWTLDVSGRGVGTSEHFQVWGRDPNDSTGFGSSLSNGVRVQYCR